MNKSDLLEILNRAAFDIECDLDGLVDVCAPAKDIKEEKALLKKVRAMVDEVENELKNAREIKVLMAEHPENLDDAVLSAAESLASNANNGGIDAQAEFLACAGWDAESLSSLIS